MNKLNVAAIAAILALAAVLGTVAATRTTSLGAARRHAADASVLARTKQLDRLQAALERALAKKPPALPAKPRPGPASVAAPAAPAAAPRVVYRRPAPIVVVKHLHHGDDGPDGGAEEGGGDA